jgi:hypothetical protein
MNTQQPYDFSGFVSTLINGAILVGLYKLLSKVL